MFGPDSGDWRQRLAMVVDTLREMSLHTEPEAMVRSYGARMRNLLATDRMVAISRRGLTPPNFRITRSSLWSEQVDPWKEPHKLPLLSGGLLGELLYADEPRLIDDLRIASDDPAAEYFEGMKSLISLPLYDQGIATNMVVFMRRAAGAFDPEDFPQWMLMSGLFGRATYSLVVSAQLAAAYELTDRELRTIADIQRSLLPSELPKISTMELAAYYQTSRRAGGDYYDFFPLENDQWGILIADVSGHGTPAAVMMAITHSIAHTMPGPPTPPCRLLDNLNSQLIRHYTRNSGTFVTAFYGIYDAQTRLLRYANAGHNPPRLKRCDDGSMASLDGVGSFPLGITADVSFEEARLQLRAGDQIIFYTDGITEAQNAEGEMFGEARLDEVLGACRPGAQQLIDAVLESVAAFSNGRPADDDRTVLVAKVK
ncbi:MAG: hypothetical protein HBSAPP02_18480 [Phycisphaerae bacterium]|nr:MAG: PP2C family protein-serine/threonine phosphatase [Planctomycetia bacterium]RIK69590.1 MAG: stage II sporulation protein E [Planctomycetota bacterium]GJQ26816.1 MAG: hypothetical protein HBSAPP02_18480 [Phycisphaerae bacterium]